MARQRIVSGAAGAAQKPPAQLKLVRKRDHDEVDPATLDQQAKSSKRSKSDEGMLNQLREQVKNDQSEFKQMIQKRSDQVDQEDKRRRDDMVSMLGKALNTSDRPSLHATTTSRSPKFFTNPLFTSASKLSDSCENLLSQYEFLETTVKQMTNEQTKSVTAVWVKEVEDMERLLGLGHKKAVRDIKRALGIESEAIKDGASNISEFQRNVEHDFALQKSLRYAERGVRRMVKSLPRDGIEEAD
ncbi:unnamed protein product [Periconia digitata]|uniref:Uncharacterized protein n=1 Tax=Periconia digitata TaxID=1303443 RepID=A0A9W4U8J7_9PLEO|nr:unnamed protein product [Periconia digitata]